MPPAPAPRPAGRWARKRFVLPAIGFAFFLGLGAGGSDNSDTVGKTGDTTKVAADKARPTPTVTVTTTATATATAKPEPAPTVTATKTAKVKVTVTARAAPAGGSSGGGDGGADTTGTCSIVSSSGNCYAAGQFCRNSDHGASTTNASGTRITCSYRSNAWRWTYS
ncbi:hypothetical protein [Streptomyces sp. NPDC002580]|uniref:hypothetical protein n=1 Tax=Streptomyces sp. NPDC002580 TaxID=3364653 RepID=UPI0036BA2CD4